jgi:hypothetical protein
LGSIWGRQIEAIMLGKAMVARALEIIEKEINAIVIKGAD